MNSQTSQPVVKHRRQDRKISTSLRSAAKVPVEDIKEVLWPRVDLSVVFPKSLACEEVGAFGVCDKLWLLLTFDLKGKVCS